LQGAFSLVHRQSITGAGLIDVMAAAKKEASPEASSYPLKPTSPVAIGKLARQPSSLSGSSPKSPPGGLARASAKFEDKQQKFSRVEFTCALVQIAIKRYIDTKQLTDVSIAVERLLGEDLRSQLKRVHASPTNFRCILMAGTRTRAGERSMGG
jgi:hypothetical protein